MTDKNQDSEFTITPAEVRNSLTSFKKTTAFYNAAAVVGLATSALLVTLLATSAIPVGYGMAAGIGAAATGVVGAFSGLCAYFGKKGLDGASLKGLQQLANDLETNPALALELNQELAKSKATGNIDQGAEIFSAFAEKHGYLKPINAKPDQYWTNRITQNSNPVNIQRN